MFLWNYLPHVFLILGEFEEITRLLCELAEDLLGFSHDRTDRLPVSCALRCKFLVGFFSCLSGSTIVPFTINRFSEFDKSRALKENAFSYKMGMLCLKAMSRLVLSAPHFNYATNILSTLIRLSLCSCSAVSVLVSCLKYASGLDEYEYVTLGGC